VELIIIRHAQPEAQDLGEGGPADPPLSALGVQQAAATAALLATEGVSHVVTSTMLRAIQTGQPLADLLGITPEAIGDLKESDHQRATYTPAEEMNADHEVVKEFLTDPMAMFSDGYETFRERVWSAFDSIVEANRGGRVAAYCHSMVAAVYLQVLLGHDDPFAVMADYCGIMRVTASSSGIRTLRSVNETGHLRHLG
jgi:probable phosphoglycerate mutase